MLTFVKNELNQVSLITTKEIKKDQIIFDLNMGEFFDHPSLRTIELAPGLHVDHPWGRYTNHSCDPTCYVSKIDKTMRAGRDLAVGEEITFNYTKNESNISTSFKCLCGSRNCVGFIGGKDSQPSHL